MEIYSVFHKTLLQTTKDVCYNEISPQSFEQRTQPLPALLFKSVM